jgi:hypothetical protein
MIYGREFWGSKVWYLLHAFSINNNLKIPENKKHNYYLCNKKIYLQNFFKKMYFLIKKHFFF